MKHDSPYEVILTRRITFKNGIKDISVEIINGIKDMYYDCRGSSK